MRICLFLLPPPLHASSSLQMFTVLSIDPVAIRGEVGEKEHAVTYLQQRTEITRRQLLSYLCCFYLIIMKEMGDFKGKLVVFIY